MNREDQPLLGNEGEDNGSETTQRGEWRIGAMKVRRAVKCYAKETCSVETLKKRFPITNWLPKYR